MDRRIEFPNRSQLQMLIILPSANCTNFQSRVKQLQSSVICTNQGQSARGKGMHVQIRAKMQGEKGVHC